MTALPVLTSAPGGATLRCAIYTRTATLDPDGRTQARIEAQRNACVRAIEQHPGWSLVEARYDDPGHNGGHTHRPALQRLLRDVEAHLVNVVVVQRWDRLSRRFRFAVPTIDRILAAGATFVCLRPALTTWDPRGQHWLAVVRSFADRELEALYENRLARGRR